MRLSIATALLGPTLLVSGAAIQHRAVNTSAVPIPLDRIPHHKKIVKPEEVFSALVEKGLALLDGTLLKPESKPQAKTFNDVSVMATGTCTNPRRRTEWDSYSNDDKHAYINAIKCLMGRPASGMFAPAQNRYEDLVRLHQSVTNNVHDNAKFLIWHRYFVWVFEDMMRSECGFDRDLPWWDEGRNTGRFAASSVFSDEFFGPIAIGGQCLTRGQFANRVSNIGPGENNQQYCLSRAGDSSQTGQITEGLINDVNAFTDYKDMAYWAEYSYHAYGHMGVGGTQADKYASPADPWFWLHHAYVDRNYANWQGNDAPARLQYINGNDINNNPLNLDTRVYMNGLRPDVPIRDIIEVQGSLLCYYYQY